MNLSFQTLIACLMLVLCTGFSSIADPVLEVSAQKYTAKPGEVFPVNYTVSWEGNPGAYTVLPPELPSLAWGSAELLEVKSRKAGSTNETCLVVGFLAASPGDYETPALDIRVVRWPGGHDNAVTAVLPEVSAQVLSAAPVRLAIRGSKPLVVVAAGAVLVLVVVGGAWLLLRRRGRTDSGAEKPDLEEQGKSLLHEARRHRLDGDYYGFYRALRQACDLASRISGDLDERLCARLDERIKDTGYRGQRPSDDDLEGDFKDVEHWITRLNRHP